MVKEMEGAGQHYRSFLEQEGFDLNKFDKLFFRQVNRVDGDSISEEDIVLKKLACLPDFNDRSLLVTNVVNTDESDLRLLLVPKGCSRLRDSIYPSTDEMPNPDETFLVEVWNLGNLSQRCKVPVLHINPDEACRIAKRRFNIASNIPKKYLEADPVLVTPDDWVEYWRHLILDKKEYCPDFVKRFADLKECVEQVRRERILDLPSTIIR